MSDLVIREVTQNVWTFSRPFTLFGFLPIGGRSTAIRLESGDVWVLASTPLTDETKQKLAELGDVKYIVAGNLFHHMFLKDFKDAYPNAQLIGPEGLKSRKEFLLRGLDLDAVLSENTETKFGWENEIDICYFSGYANKDTAFYHKPSKTVIGADLLFNNPPTEQFSKSSQSPKSLLFAAMHPTGWQMKWFIKSKAENKAALSLEAKKVAEWDFDRYIMCHGDVIETGANAAWRSAWANFLS